MGRFPAFFQGNLVCPNHLQVQLVTLTSKLMAPSKAALSKNRPLQVSLVWLWYQGDVMDLMLMTFTFPEKSNISEQ